MKKVKSIFLLFLLIILNIACSKKNDSTNRSLNGNVWEYSYEDGETFSLRRFTFRENMVSYSVTGGSIVNGVKHYSGFMSSLYDSDIGFVNYTISNDMKKMIYTLSSGEERIYERQ